MLIGAAIICIARHGRSPPSFWEKNVRAMQAAGAKAGVMVELGRTGTA